MSDIGIFNPEGQAGTIDASELPQALQSGFSLPKGQVQVVNPEGQLGTIDAAEAAQALNSGYQYASPDVLQKLKYGSGTQQAIAGAEGLARGVLGPIAPALEKAFGVPEKDQLGRAKENKGTAAGTEVLGLLSPIGEGALLAKAGTAATKSMRAISGAERIAQSGARGAIETALFSAGDETSKMLLHDPDQSAETAIANIGLSAVLGGGLGAAFGAAPVAWNAVSESKGAQFINDFRSRIKSHLDNPAPEKMLGEELTNLHNSVKDAEATYGLKHAEIRKLLPTDSTEAINKSTLDMTEKFEALIGKTREKSGMEAVTQKLEQDYAELGHAMKQGPAEYFDALNTLKRKMQKYEFAYQPEFTPGANFKPMASAFRRDIMNHLEDSSVWGKAAERQKGFNKAYSNLLTPLDEFEKLATTTVNGEKIIDPGKLETYVGQLGKAKGEVKQAKVENFIDAAQAFHKELNKTHANLGLEALPSPSLGHTLESLKDVPAGAKVADALIKHGLAKAASTGTGAAIGSLFGHPELGAIIGAHSLEKLFDKVLPAIMNPLLQGRTSAAGLKAATDMGMAVAKGQSKLDKAAKAVFGGASEAVQAADVGKLNSKVLEFQTNPEMLLNNNRKVADYMPEAETALSAASIRIMQHLAQLAPKETPLAPLSPNRVPAATEVARYNSALQIAQEPLSVMVKLGKGTMTQQNIDDLRVMYPKLHAEMGNKLMHNAIEAQAKSILIPYQVKLGMSKFLGTPFDPSLQPGNLLGAQTASSAQSPRQSPQPDASVKHVEKLDKVSSAIRTPAQSRESSRHK